MDVLDLPANTLCALVGPPGSGKSTFAARYPDSWRVCLDVYRHLATDSFSVKFSVLSTSRPLPGSAGSRPLRPVGLTGSES